MAEKQVTRPIEEAISKGYIDKYLKTGDYNRNVGRGRLAEAGTNYEWAVHLLRQEDFPTKSEINDILLKAAKSYSAAGLFTKGVICFIEAGHIQSAKKCAQNALREPICKTPEGVLNNLGNNMLSFVRSKIGCKDEQVAIADLKGSYNKIKNEMDGRVEEKIRLARIGLADQE